MPSPIRTSLSLVIAAAAVMGLVGLWWVFNSPDPEPAVTSQSATRESPVHGTRPTGRYMFNVTLHTPQEIYGMLHRAEELAAQGKTVQSDTGIALVLHGPEIQLFTKKNYEANRSLIELARRLDHEGIIEIKMCRTAMRDLDVKESDVFSFVSFVPYAPDEIKRLEADGYVYL